MLWIFLIMGNDCLAFICSVILGFPLFLLGVLIILYPFFLFCEIMWNETKEAWYDFKKAKNEKDNP